MKFPFKHLYLAPADEFGSGIGGQKQESGEKSEAEETALLGDLEDLHKAVREDVTRIVREEIQNALKSGKPQTPGEQQGQQTPTQATQKTKPAIEIPDGADASEIKAIIDAQVREQVAAAMKDRDARIDDHEAVLVQQSIERRVSANAEVPNELRAKVVADAEKLWKSGFAANIDQAVEDAAALSGIARPAAAPEQQESEAQTFRRRSRGRGPEPTPEERAQNLQDEQDEAIFNKYGL